MISLSPSELSVAVEWFALILGTLGTLLWSLNRNQALVAALWLASSLLWIWFSQQNGHYGLTVRDALGVVMYSAGLITYMKNARSEPLKES